jgi:hypothetical protein
MKCDLRAPSRVLAGGSERQAYSEKPGSGQPELAPESESRNFSFPSPKPALANFGTINARIECILFRVETLRALPNLTSIFHSQRLGDKVYRDEENPD